MAGVETQIDKRVKCVENAFGACKSIKRTYANCAVRCTQTDDGSAALDQGEYIKQLRPVQRPELTEAEAEEKATKTASDMFVYFDSPCGSYFCH